MIHDRYHAAGLSGNPFAAHHDNGKHQDGVHRWFVDRGLPAPPPPGSNTLVQVVGDKGFGKSTHLARWRHDQPGPYHYIVRSPYRHRWHEPPVAPLVYGDEIDRMPAPRRHRWFRRLADIKATVVIGTHHDLGRLGRRFGFSIETHRLTPASVEELELVLHRRLAAAALDGAQPTIRFSAGDVATIMTASAGNLRAADAAGHRILAERLAGLGQSLR